MMQKRQSRSTDPNLSATGGQQDPARAGAEEEKGVGRSAVSCPVKVSHTLKTHIHFISTSLHDRSENASITGTVSCCFYLLSRSRTQTAAASLAKMSLGRPHPCGRFTVQPGHAGASQGFSKSTARMSHNVPAGATPADKWPT